MPTRKEGRLATAAARLGLDPTTELAEQRIYERGERWLLTFAQTDVTTLTPGELLDARRNAALFFSGRILRSLADVGGRDLGRSPDEQALRGSGPTNAVFVSVHKELRTGLEALRSGRPWPVTLPHTTVLMVKNNCLRRAYLRRPNSFRDLFLALAVEVLESTWSRIFPCPYCGRLFIKEGKQQYCSPVCSQRRRQETFRSKRSRRTRDFRNEREKAVRNRLGPTARIRLGLRRQDVKSI